MAITFSSSYDTAPSIGEQSAMSASLNMPNVTASGNTFTIPAFTATLTPYAYKTSTYLQARQIKNISFWGNIVIGGTGTSTGVNFTNSATVNLPSSTGWASANVSATQGALTFNTGTFFTSSNKTTRTLSISVKRYGWSYAFTAFGSAGNFNTQNGSGTATLTLNAPPTYKVVDSSNVETTSVWFDTPDYVYAGLTTASIRVRNLSAKYSGYISKIQFNIGAQSQVLNFDEANPPGSSETLSILLGASGTFTPTVTVTDSRGQTTTTTLSSIMVNAYSAPAVSFVPERTKSTGVSDDEGTYAAFPATFTFTDAIATLAAPTVVLIDEGGTQSTPTVNWYSSRAADGTLSGSVTWANLSSGDTVYGRVSTSGGLNTQKSYQIKITPSDDMGTGTPIIQTLAPAFYTVDFLAGGHGIAFGKPATDEGFECAMDATFEDNVFIDLPEYTTADTTDKAIYDAIVTLGWDSDVLVN